ncbi:MAG: hypothetical protein ABFS19_12905 [Thermodesulfobacteriota bacterium]
MPLCLSGCAHVDFSAVYEGKCVRIADLSRDGSHKDAVDLEDKLEKYGLTCSTEVQELAEESRSRLDQANDYVRQALEQKKEGDLPAAKANMQNALNVYPKYYWVQELLKNVETALKEQGTVVQDEAENHSPGKKLEYEEAVELQDENERLSLSREMEKQEPKPGSAKQPGREAEKEQGRVREHRREIAAKGLEAARQAEKKEDLEEASQQLLKVLELSSAGEELTPEIVEYARVLGMKFFSTGNFTRAQALWQEALRLSPGNVELQRYLDEVEAGLAGLQKIKEEEGKQPQSSQ